MSWKVRRAAAKCLAALLGSRPDLLPDLHHSLAPALVQRFREREDNVKADVFAAYIVLLRQIRPPQGWLQAVEEPTPTGSSLQLLRGQVSWLSSPLLSLGLVPFLFSPHLLTCVTLAQATVLGIGGLSMGWACFT